MERLVVKTRAYLKANREKLGLPFLPTFPKNCCEIASLILAYIIKDEYPEKEVFIVKAKHPDNGNHFWVEVDDMIFDITADQINGVTLPIIKTPKRLTPKNYVVYEKKEINTELKGHDWSDQLQTLPKISQAIRWAN